MYWKPIYIYVRGKGHPPEESKDITQDFFAHLRAMNYYDDVIYAPTAAMLYQFREVGILGQETRVLHFDQPVFAWK